jgi:predicted nucleic acid-binding protein
VRRKRVVFGQAMDYLKIINEMVIDVDPPDSTGILQLPHLAEAYNLTGYDAAFLELAMRRQLPLATNDKALCEQRRMTAYSFSEFRGDCCHRACLSTAEFA